MVMRGARGGGGHVVGGAGVRVAIAEAGEDGEEPEQRTGAIDLQPVAAASEVVGPIHRLLCTAFLLFRMG